MYGFYVGQITRTKLKNIRIFIFLHYTYQKKYQVVLTCVLFDLWFTEQTDENFYL